MAPSDMLLHMSEARFKYGTGVGKPAAARGDVESLGTPYNERPVIVEVILLSCHYYLSHKDIVLNKPCWAKPLHPPSPVQYYPHSHLLSLLDDIDGMVHVPICV